MKSKSIFFLISICILTACDKEHSPELSTSETLYEVRFRIEPEPEIVAFQSTKSIPQNYPPEPTPVKSEGEPDENDLSFSFIEYAVFDAAKDTLVHHIRFSENDKQLDDFGVFVYDTLKAGNYKVCMITHAIEEASLSGNKLSFPDIDDTFYGSAQISVQASTAGQEKEIILKRIVSRVEFVATDAVPEKVKTFRISVSERFNTVDLLTGETYEDATPHEENHTFTTAERGENYFNTHAFYTLVPSGEDVKLSRISLVAKDVNNENVRERTLINIPVIVNTITRYKGILYTPGILDDRFDLTFENDGKWTGLIEEELPE